MVREDGQQLNSQIKKIGFEDITYPTKLRHISNPPKVLYVLGELPEKGKPCIAIVGARNASPYGMLVAEKFAEILAESGILIVSGMARGIDASAHIGALKTGSKTYGVLGNGVDICYPKENWNIYRQIINNGGLISELLPGTSPLARFFPMRNRIISAFADIVLVIEAKERSGALITADRALEQGKDVFAVPGRITDELSKGCNYLIAQGAGVAISPDELLKELNINNSKNEKLCEKKEILLATEEKSVYSCMSLQPKHINEIVNESRMHIQQLSSVILSLEMKSLIKEVTKNYYIRL